VRLRQRWDALHQQPAVGQGLLRLHEPGEYPYSGGTLKCSSPSNCQVDLSACTYCGDAQRNGAEECDGGDLGSQNCQGLGFASGTLTCSSSCTHDKSACVAVPNPLVVCRSPNLPIPDFDLDGAIDTIDIPDSATVTDVDVQVVATHSWVGDVYVELYHDGVYRALIDQPACHPSSTAATATTSMRRSTTRRRRWRRTHATPRRRRCRGL